MIEKLLQGNAATAGFSEHLKRPEMTPSLSPVFKNTERMGLENYMDLYIFSTTAQKDDVN